MRHLLLVVALLASVTTHGEAQNDAQKSAAMERELRGLYQHLLDALRAKDTAAVRPILADGYLFTDGFTGRVSNKTERLRALAADTSRIDTLAVDSMFVRNYEGAAVASALVRQVGRDQGKQYRDLVRVTIVFVSSPGKRWQIAATHLSAGRPETH